MENKLVFAKEIIKEAGAFIKDSLSKTITVEEKTAFDDLVTNIDKINCLIIFYFMKLQANSQCQTLAFASSNLNLSYSSLKLR